ncbi:MAG: hypothetical protein WCR71_04965 [Bacteroidales bacterium]
MNIGTMESAPINRELPNERKIIALKGLLIIMMSDYFWDKDSESCR